MHYKSGIKTYLLIPCFMAIFLGQETILQGKESGAERRSSHVLTFVSARALEDPVTQWLVLIFTEALKRMGLGFEFINVPPGRASAYSNSGRVDGELGRASNFHELHPNLIRVPEHNTRVTFSAFVSNPAITLAGWDSLKQTEYQVRYRRGITKCAQRLSAVIPVERLSHVTTMPQGIKGLLTGRNDVYVDVESLVMQYLRSEDFLAFSKGQSVYRAGVMEQDLGYAFLHKRHRALVPKLAAILRNMKQEGLFGAYRDQVGLTSDDISW